MLKAQGSNPHRKKGEEDQQALGTEVLKDEGIAHHLRPESGMARGALETGGVPLCLACVCAGRAVQVDEQHSTLWGPLLGQRYLRSCLA